MRHHQYGKLLCVGIRGAAAKDPLLQSDLATCAQAGVGAVVLFDVDATKPNTIRNIENPDQLVALIAIIKQHLGDDVLVCVDQEGGSVSRLNNRRGFVEGPTASQYAKLSEADQRTEAARQAAQVARAGFDVNFVPCVDLALEPDSTIIAGAGRSYSDDPDTVIECAQRVIEAHRDADVRTCLKHFPGHGSATGDTHLGFVDVTETFHPKIELAPYRALLRDAPADVAVMMSHVLHRGIDPARPASLSAKHIDGLLRTEIGFLGVVITDSIDMQAIAQQHDAGQATVLALLAGADMILHGWNLADNRDEHPAPMMVNAIAQAVNQGILSPARIQTSLDRLETYACAHKHA